MVSQKILGISTNFWIFIPFILILATVIKTKMDAEPVDPNRMTDREIDALIERGYGTPEEVARAMKEIRKDMKKIAPDAIDWKPGDRLIEKVLEEADGEKINEADSESKL
ncbi:hypothetical protein N9D38_08220 [Rubripirellula sp.]|nr:hypothetical protein [Rubripirellula sp.]